MCGVSFPLGIQQSHLQKYPGKRFSPSYLSKEAPEKFGKGAFLYLLVVC